MKNLHNYFLVILIAAGLVSCGEEEPEILEAPTFTVTATSSAVKIDNSTDITVNVTSAPGGIATITASVSGGGTVSGISAGALAGETSGSVTGTFTAGSTPGTATVVVTVTDQQGTPLETTEVLAITVTELDPPAVSLSASSATLDIGSTVAFDMTFTAEAGLTGYEISLGGEVVDGAALTGTSGSASFAWEIPATTAAGNLMFTVTVTDANSTSNSTNFMLTVNEATPATRFATAFVQWNNEVTDPGMADWATTGNIIPGAAASGNVYATGDAFFDEVTYKGAVSPDAVTPWYATENWSFYAHLVQGIADKARTQGAGQVTITDNDLDGDGVTDDGLTTINWAKDNTYYLDGFVFIGEGQTLNIEAGTVIKGNPGQQENASALVVARGGKIMAMGTATEPIIMTYAADPLDGSITATQRGQWGGLIVLGRAGLNSANGTTQIEGIPTSEPRGLYGGNADDDNSGVIQYVSIRHGGSDIGAGNEINGLTLGGVGNSTVIENVEVIGNADDGIEWFGGTAQAKNLIVAYTGDDALDYDEGYRGKNQYVIVHQDAAAGDRGGEHDGGTSPETGSPYATPTFANVTSIGRATSRAITFRDNAGGYYYNSIFISYGSGIDIEDLTDQEQDTYKQFLDGNLALTNNIFFGIGAGDSASDIFKISN